MECDSATTGRLHQDAGWHNGSLCLDACTCKALALYYRLNPDYTVRACIYALATLVSGYSLAITVVAAGPCNPRVHTDQKCLTDLNLFMACVNIITDFLILCLPIPMLRALQLPLKQKILLALVFALGSG